MAVRVFGERMLAAAALLALAGAAMAQTTRPATAWYLDGPYAGDEEHRRMIERLRPRAAALDDPAIGHLVEGLVGKDEADEAYWTLAVLERRAVPALVASLKDRQFLTAKAVNSSSGFDRVWELLEPVSPEEAVPPLVALLADTDEGLRLRAALGLGSLAKPSCVAPLRQALGPGEEQLRAWALMGLDGAIRQRRASPQFLSELFDAVARAVDLPALGHNDAPRVLLEMDRERAKAFLLSPERFHLDHDAITSILSALAQARVAVPAEKPLALLEEIGETPATGRGMTYGYGLQLLALSGHPSAAGKAEKAMAHVRQNPLEENWSAEAVRRLGAEAYLILHGIPDAYDVAITAWTHAGDAATLPVPLRNYATVQVLWNEVENGGLSQYFYNSYARDVSHAVAGLEAVGAVKSAALVKKALELFGPGGPSPDREKRQEQLERVNAPALNALTEELLSDPDHLQVLLARYAVKHAEHFARH